MKYLIQNGISSDHVIIMVSTCFSFDRSVFPMQLSSLEHCFVWLTVFVLCPGVIYSVLFTLNDLRFNTHSPY